MYEVNEYIVVGWSGNVPAWCSIEAKNAEEAIYNARHDIDIIEPVPHPIIDSPHLVFTNAERKQAYDRCEKCGTLIRIVDGN